MNTNEYFEERKVLIDNYNAQIRGHAEYLIAISILMFSVISLQLQNQSTDVQKPYQVLAGISLAILFLLFILSALTSLFVYTLGRMLYWSQMASWVMVRLPTPEPTHSDEDVQIFTPLKGLDESTVNGVLKKHRYIRYFFKWDCKAKPIFWVFLTLIILCLWYSIFMHAR